MTSRVICLALYAAALLFPALPAHAGALRDMVGREVILTAPPRRVISLVPSVTETLYAVGADDLLVGVTSFCDFPPAAREKPKVGGIVNPSLETIVSLRPDLVLASTEGNRDSTIDQLTALGIPTYVVSPKKFAGLVESVIRIGQLVGREEAARRLAAEIGRRALRVVEVVRDRARPSVLYLIWADPIIVPGRDTLLTDLIRMAGGVSVSERERIEWPRLSVEQVVVAAPEVVVVASHSYTHVDDTLRRWRTQKILLPAFTSGRVYTVEGNLLHRPGPRIVDGLEALANAIHPGALR